MAGETEWLRKNRSKYKDRIALAKACRAATGGSSNSVASRLRELEARDGRGGTAKKKTSRGRSMSRQAFLSQFDEDTRARESIRTGLASLLDDELLRDSEFRTDRCEYSNATNWRRITEEDEFLPFQFRCDNKVWWATKATVQWALKNVARAKGM